jgi:hypothetical protein
VSIPSRGKYGEKRTSDYPWGEGKRTKGAVDVLVASGVFSHVWGFVGLMMGLVGLCWGFTPTWENKQV